MRILWDNGNVGFGGCGINEWDRNVINALVSLGHEVKMISDPRLRRRPKLKTWIRPVEGVVEEIDTPMTVHNYSEVVKSLGPFDIQVGNHFTMFPMLDNIVPVVHDYHIKGRESYTQGIKLSLAGLTQLTNRFICTTPYIQNQLNEAHPGLDTQVVYGGCKFKNASSEKEINDHFTPMYIAYWGNRYADGKNFLSLLKTLPYHNLDLVVCGFSSPQKKELDLIEQMGIQDRVTYHTGLSDEELPKVISGAKMYVCPSTYEGFGLPALEAMSLGIPTVVSPCASLPSVVGDSGWVAKSHKTKDLAEAIQVVLDNPEETERKRLSGLDRSSQWTWEETAKKIVSFCFNE